MAPAPSCRVSASMVPAAFPGSNRINHRGHASSLVEARPPQNIQDLAVAPFLIELIVNLLFFARPPNGLELSYPAEAGNGSSLYVTPTGRASCTNGPARRVSFSEMLGAITHAFRQTWQSGRSPGLLPASWGRKCASHATCAARFRASGQLQLSVHGR